MPSKKRTTVADLRTNLIHTFSMRVSAPLHDRIVALLEKKGNGNASDWVRSAIAEKLDRDELDQLRQASERAKYKL